MQEDSKLERGEGVICPMYVHHIAVASHQRRTGWVPEQKPFFGPPASLYIVSAKSHAICMSHANYMPKLSAASVFQPPACKNFVLFTLR